MRRAARVLIPLAVVALASTAFALPDVPGSEHQVPTATLAEAPLVADAGASLRVGAGQRAVLLGTAFGGDGDYSYGWSANGGTVLDTSNATAVIDTTDVTPGSYVGTLTVTDGDGTVATDTVVYEVAGEPDQTTLLDETVEDNHPDAGTSAREFPFTVPAGIARLDITLEFSNPSNDYDLVVLDPDGAEAGSSGNLPSESEGTGVVAPAPGEWKILATRYLTTVEPALHAMVVGTAVVASGNLPTADTGGPYEFETGTAQELEGVVTGDDLTVGWDTDLDGVVDVDGATPTLDLPTGRHLVSLHVVDGDGREAREMTHVNVGSAEQLRELTVPFTVVAVADSGINPYHAEFSAATYPDPEVLELTRNFTRHPSEYIPGYPEDAVALPISTGEGYFPDADTHLWTGNDFVKAGQIHWIPGTKIIGAVDAGGSTGATSGADTHPLLDDNGHGTGSSSVSTGNRYGYCPACLLVHVEALDESFAAGLPWVDLSSNSFGAIGGIPLGLLGVGDATKIASERGQLTFFSAGNGTGNAFATTPILTYGSEPNGADWVITVGATREDNQGAIVSDGYPVHISGLGDGDLPSACRTGDTGQCAFGGTSAASPYTAGAFGTILNEIRDVLGDPDAGQKPGQVVAQGDPVPGSPFLADGILTRRELRAVGLKTAFPRQEGLEPSNPYAFPWTYAGDQSVYFEGYGSSGPAHAERAIAVLLGERPMPARTTEDEFFAEDCSYRDGIHGGYDRDGDGEEDGCDEAGFAVFVGDAEGGNVDPADDDFDASRDAVGEDVPMADPFIYFLHRVPRFEPTVEPDTTPGGSEDALEGGQVCGEDFNEMYMDRENTPGDAEPCFDARITSTAAAFRPKGIFTATEQLDAPLPAGSRIQGAIYMQSAEPTTTSMELVFKATDREVARSAAVTAPTNPASWTAFEFDFTTDRNIAAGEQLTVNIVQAGARAYAYGFEEDHASSITVTPAASTEGLDFGVTVDEVEVVGDDVVVSGRVSMTELGSDPQLAGFHRVIGAVQVSGDETFERPVHAEVDEEAGTYVAVLGGAAPASTTSRATVELADGDTVHVRALRDRFPSATVTATISGEAPAPNPTSSPAPIPTTGTPSPGASPTPAPAGGDKPMPATGGGAALLGLALLGGAFAARRRG